MVTEIRWLKKNMLRSCVGGGGGRGAYSWYFTVLHVDVCSSFVCIFLVCINEHAMKTATLWFTCT